MQHAAVVHRIEPDHLRVLHQLARRDAEHHAAARHVIELDNPLGHHERVVIGDRDRAGAEFDVLGALRRSGDHQFRSGDGFDAAGVVFADPDFIEPDPIEVDDHFHVLLERHDRVEVGAVIGAREQAEPHSLCDKLHLFASSIWAEMGDGPRVSQVPENFSQRHDHLSIDRLVKLPKSHRRRNSRRR